MAEFAKTQAIAAEKLGVTRAALVDWSTHGDFPKATKSGWNVDKIRAWAKKHSRGPFRRGAAGAANSGKATTVNGVTLAEANIRKTIEEAENARIKKELQLAEQARGLGELVAVSDVRKLYKQTVATVSAVHDSLADAVDRAMPDAAPSESAWPAIRERVLGYCQKLGADAAAAMKELA